MGRNILSKLAIVAMVALCSMAQAAVTPRFEGLRRDTLYMSLIGREAALSAQRESLLSDIANRRAEFSNGEGSKQSELEALESDLFDLQRELSGVSSAAREIEQRWELDNLNVDRADGVVAEATSGDIEIVGESVATIVESRVVREMLSEDNFELLQSVVEREREADGLYAEFVDLYNKMRDTKQLYSQTESESDAAGYMATFRAITPQADSLLVVLDRTWSRVYDDKVFLYNLMLETLGQEDLLLKSEEMLREWGAKIPEESDDAAIVAVEYDAQKRALLQYDITIGEVLKLKRATTASRDAFVRINASGDVVLLRDVEIRERNFIDYEDIKFSSAPKYKKGEIPDAKLYKKGTIYRIQLGAFKLSQLPSIFRGAYPLSFDKALGFWTYYAGGYETMLEAQKGQELCKKRGFKRPEIVVWRNGVRRNISREPLAATKGYRVSVDGVSDISPAVEAVIARICGKVDITRVGADHYIVGDIANIYIAEELVEALSVEVDDVTITINKIE